MGNRPVRDKRRADEEGRAENGVVESDVADTGTRRERNALTLWEIGK